MNIGYAILGLVVGGFVAGTGGSFLIGAAGGAVIGMLLGRLSHLSQRVDDLEHSARLDQQESAGQWGGTTPPETAKEPPAWARPAEPAADSPLPETAEAAPLTAEAGAGAVLVPEHTGTEDDWQRPVPERVDTGPSPIQKIYQKAYDWLTTGNVPVKIGVIITFIGVSFLLKYAIDRELLVIPIEFRLLAVAIAGLALIAIGWRLREKMRVYALSLQGGGIGILFLTIFAAFRIWELLPGPLAFVLLVALTFFTGALAVLQDARSLAILGMTGGFLAPILTSTGQGNHVALFSYYLVLNGAILGISWFRAWRSLNLLGFVFTFLIGSLWGYKYYKPGLMDSTMPFLVLHFLFYNIIAILYALRQPPDKPGIVDGTLVFGTPVIAFALQSELVRGTEYGLAISAAVVAVFYVLVARFLWKHKGEYLRLMTESYIALAVAFATITIPLALDARWTSAAWALEGAALVWVGMRQQRHLANLAGVALVFLAGASFMEYGWKSGRGIAVINGNFLGGVLISLSAFFTSRKLKAFGQRALGPVYKFCAVLLFLWGAAWWLGSGFLEIIDRLPRAYNEGHTFLIFVSLSFAAAAWIARTRQWDMMRSATFVFLPLIVLPALYVWITDQHFLFGMGYFSWPLAWVVQGYILKRLDDRQLPLLGAWHFISLIMLTFMVSLEGYWWARDAVSDVWGGMVAVTLPGIVAMLVWRLRNRPDWPVPVHPDSYLNASILLVTAQVVALTAMSISDPGNPEPLPYIPVLNPFDLAMLFAMVVTSLSLAAIRRESDISGEPALSTGWPAYKLMMAVLFFILTTTALVRGVHHFAGVRWDDQALGNSVIVQTSLSIYWGLLGFIGMIWGARSQRRPVWLAGAAFMALVVLKLFLVDLGNTGTVERIVSFLGIGALLLVVGYFAPAPPKQSAETAVEEVTEDDE
jgi:uncharacterized membrane protein